jgi:GTPase SAR1 family protein
VNIYIIVFVSPILRKDLRTFFVCFRFDNFSDTIEVDGFPYNVTLWDTAGQEEYKNLRILSYPNVIILQSLITFTNNDANKFFSKTDVFLLCYAVNIRSTFENIITKWIPELKHYCPHTSIVLVGKSQIKEIAYLLFLIQLFIRYKSRYPARRPIKLCMH